MAELTEEQKVAVSLAIERLPRRHAEIFIWHNFGKPDKDGIFSEKWTYSELATWYGKSFREISGSLKESREILRTAVEASYDKGVPIFVSGSQEDIDFRIWLQIGSQSLPRIDSTAQAAVGKIHRREQAA